jgi:single-strand DNA-binding protein
VRGQQGPVTSSRRRHPLDDIGGEGVRNRDREIVLRDFPFAPAEDHGPPICGRRPGWECRAFRRTRRRGRRQKSRCGGRALLLRPRPRLGIRTEREQLRAICRCSSFSSLLRRRTSLIFARGLSPCGQKILPIRAGSLTRCGCPAPLLVENIPGASRTAFRGCTKSVRLQPGMMFAFSPESCSGRPGIRTISNGSTLTSFSVATQRSWKNSEGVWESRTEWHRCISFGRLADFAATLKKGAHVQVEGELRGREYEKDGAKHKVFECRLESIVKLDRAERREEDQSDRSES